MNKLDSRSGSEEFAQLENEVVKQHNRLAESKRKAQREKIADYKLNSTGSPVALSSLFRVHNDLIVVHNMGQSCRYCTMWADGFNGIYPHLANRAGFALVSPDPPERQRAFAQSRGWRFPIYSAEGSKFIKDMGFIDEEGDPIPGVSTFVREGKGDIFRAARAPFGPFDPFCATWHLFALGRRDRPLGTTA